MVTVVLAQMGIFNYFLPLFSYSIDVFYNKKLYKTIRWLRQCKLKKEFLIIFFRLFPRINSFLPSLEHFIARFLFNRRFLHIWPLNQIRAESKTLDGCGSRHRRILGTRRGMASNESIGIGKAFRYQNSIIPTPSPK